MASERRAAAFAALRRENHLADARRSPAERLRDAEALLAIARAASPGPSTTDEPPELWLRLLDKAKR